MFGIPYPRGPGDRKNSFSLERKTFPHARNVPWPSFPCSFGFPCSFLFGKEFLFFLCAFLPSFPGILGVRRWEKILVFLVFLPFYQTSKEKKIRVHSRLKFSFSVWNVHSRLKIAVPGLVFLSHSMRSNHASQQLYSHLPTEGKQGGQRAQASNTPHAACIWQLAVVRQWPNSAATRWRWDAKWGPQWGESAGQVAEADWRQSSCMQPERGSE